MGKNYNQTIVDNGGNVNRGWAEKERIQESRRGIRGENLLQVAVQRWRSGVAGTPPTPCRKACRFVPHKSAVFTFQANRLKRQLCVLYVVSPFKVCSRGNT